MVWNFVVQLVAAVLLVVSYLLTAKPKTDQPAETRDLENPTAEAGRPIPVVFGTITVKGANILWYGRKTKVDQKVRA